ncbi:MAG: 50S ribosomal protein L21 [Candidatus Eisenbacteria bacterium]|nr:50S ribosomal protein L21 [Candidatus Eisenbacteria bacterium]
MYAIVEVSGFQYRVEPESVIRVPRLQTNVGEEVLLSNVMLLSDGKDVKVGKPLVEGASVSGVVLSHGRGDKVVVFRFKRKKGYRKKTGHRQDYTELKVSAIKG